MVCVVFIAMMVEVTVSLIILSARSHEGSLSSLLVLVEGFHSVQIGWLSPHISCHHTQFFVVMGLLGLNHLVSLCIVSPGYGFVHAIDVAQWVMMVIMPRGLLKVDCYFLALFYLIILSG
jgi:hypothetical protein